MKKVLVSVIFAALALFSAPKSFSQITNIDGVWSFGGGYSTFNVSGGDSADKFNALGFQRMPGFYFGVALDYPFSAIDGLTLEPGVNIVHYGKSFRFGDSDKPKSYHCNFINIPVNLKFSFGADGFGVAIFTGPRLNLGIGGNSFSAGRTYPGIRPLDAQWGVGLGVTLADAIVIRGGYDFGLTKCLKNNKDLNLKDEIAYRNTLNIGVSFLFK